MKNLISLVIIVLLLAFSISAQENQPRLIDEGGKTNLDDLMVRLVNLGTEMKKDQSSQARIRIYGGQGEKFGFPYIYASLMKGFWQNSFKFPPEKLDVQFCNVNNETFRWRFYLVTKDSELENCDENLSVPKKTTLFETFQFYDPQIRFNSIEKSYIEIDSTGEYSAYAQVALKRLLKDSPESKIYLIVYLQTNFEFDSEDKIVSAKAKYLDSKNLARKMIQVTKNNLLKNGFSSSQIVIVDGGYVSDSAGRRIELWFVPVGGAIPKSKPDYVPTKKAK